MNTPGFVARLKNTLKLFSTSHQHDPDRLTKIQHATRNLLENKSPEVQKTISSELEKGVGHEIPLLSEAVKTVKGKNLLDR